MLCVCVGTSSPPFTLRCQLMVPRRALVLHGANTLPNDFKEQSRTWNCPYTMHSGATSFNSVFQTSEHLRYDLVERAEGKRATLGIGRTLHAELNTYNHVWSLRYQFTDPAFTIERGLGAALVIKAQIRHDHAGHHYHAPR